MNEIKTIVTNIQIRNEDISRLDNDKNFNDHIKRKMIEELAEHLFKSNLVDFTVKEDFMTNGINLEAKINITKRLNEEAVKFHRQDFERLKTISELESMMIEGKYTELMNNDKALKKNIDQVKIIAEVLDDNKLYQIIKNI